MRCALSGYTGPLPPLVLSLPSGEFVKSGYEALGYTHYDVMAIGAAGGFGSFLNYVDPYLHRNSVETGGAGGGGGAHRIQGDLSELPEVLSVVVGEAGIDGPTITDYADNTLRAFGGDGGYSSFNGMMCCASGGKGGWSTSWSQGGAGGKGGQIVAGGGGRGGSYAPSTNTYTPAEEGTWDGTIGPGGGGGNGGSGYYYDGYNFVTTLWKAADGARGSYNNFDLSVYGPAGTVRFFTVPNGSFQLFPGAGGGAKASPLTKDNVVYGSRAQGCNPGGAVILRLT